MNVLRHCLLLCTLLLLHACGGGGGGSGGFSNNSVVISGPVITGSNVLAVSVNAGLGGYSTLANRLYTSVTVCAPGSTRCASIDNVLVDTGSTGLRLIDTSQLEALGLQAPAGFAGLTNCVQFLDNSSAWGSVRIADVRLGQMSAPQIPIQLIADPALANLVSPCPGTALTHAAASSTSDGNALSANGILGIGLRASDCGSACAVNPGYGSYFSCNGNACLGASVPTNQQLRNPVLHFATDNNGYALVLPAVPPSGATSVGGSLVFGIGTHPNNQIGSATVLPVSAAGNFLIHTGVTSASPSGVADISRLASMNSSFLDTGSNGLYFGNAALPACNGNLSAFYCPPSGAPVTLNATLTSLQTGASKAISFVAGNAADLFAGSNIAMPTLTGNRSVSSFDWGLPFFFGRSVFFGMEGTSASNGSQTLTGPYYAF